MARQAHEQTQALFRVVEGQGGHDHPLAGWGTENHGYRRDNFYVGSTDPRGHNQNIQVPLPTNIAGRVAELVQDKAFPSYRTTQDFIRDAVVHRLQQLGEITEDPEVAKHLFDAMVMEMRASQIAQSARELAARRDLIDNAEQNLHAAAAEEDWLTVAEMLSLYDETAEDLTEPWRGRLEQITTTYRDRLPK